MGKNLVSTDKRLNAHYIFLRQIRAYLSLGPSLHFLFFLFIIFEERLSHFQIYICQLNCLEKKHTKS